MSPENLHYFNLLKLSVSSKLTEKHLVNSPIEEWKGEEIVLFQEDLFNSVKAKVSEKWFYTYFKNEPNKLPRIDMLNILSEYSGYKNWNHFKEVNKQKPLSLNKKKFNYWWLLLIPIGLFVFSLIGKNNQYEFCFVDDIKNEPIIKTSLDIKILHENESPTYLKTDSTGCFNYKSKKDVIRFVIQSPYHKTDTIVRYINSNVNNIVKLTTDDYALMLEFYTSKNIKDWKYHKKQLENLIADDAIIYQMFDSDLGVEIFTKDQFIRFLTIPTTSLKHVKILDKEMKNAKIVELKFILR